MKMINGFEGLYMVDHNGNIYSLPKKWSPKINMLKPFKNRNGYMYVTLVKNKKKHKFSVHYLVGDAFIKKENNKNQINHINGIKSDNRSENLEWCTQSENITHSYKALGRKKSRAWLNKKGKFHNKSKDFYIRFLDGKLVHFHSGGEFMRKTGFSKETISYIRKKGINYYQFTKGKLKGCEVFFFNLTMSGVLNKWVK